jgi:predicted dienelactone hydrolase
LKSCNKFSQPQLLSKQHRRKHHQKNTAYDADNSPENRAAIQFDRPGDLRFVIDQILLLNQDTTIFLYGLVNPKAIGMFGHSFGWHATIMVAGASPNLDYLLEYCPPNPGPIVGILDRGRIR